MATPFGGKSLLQRSVGEFIFFWNSLGLFGYSPAKCYSACRMFTSSMTQEVKELEEEIEAVKDKIEDPLMCEKVRNFVYAPREIQDVYKADAGKERIPILTAWELSVLC